MLALLVETAHILCLPFELRRQILFEAIVAEIEDSTSDDPRHDSSTEDPLVHLIMRTSNFPSVDHTACPTSSFWGRERMTRLIRTNKQIYEEGFELIWSEFPVCLTSNHPKAHLKWMTWLRAHNPRAIHMVRQLQIRTAQVIEWPCGWFESMRGSLDEQESKSIIAQIESYPNLRKADLMVTFVGVTGRESMAAKNRCSDRMRKIIEACQSRGVETHLRLVDSEDSVLGKEMLKRVKAPDPALDLNTGYHFRSQPIIRHFYFEKAA